MPAKLNTRFAMFLVLAVGAAAMLIAGLAYLNMRSNAGRNVRIGDEAYQAGDLEKARDFYGRAAHKEPGNKTYLQKLEKATLETRPKTELEAADLYRAWLGILAHGARHDARYPQAHLRLMNELVIGARRGHQRWGALEQPARDMWQNLPESEPQRYLAKTFRSMAITHRIEVATLEELVEAAADAQEAADHLSSHDLARAMLVQAKLALVEKHRSLGRGSAVIEEQLTELARSAVEAVQAAPGPETARMNLAVLVFKRSVTPDSVSEEQLHAGILMLEEALAAVADAGITLAAAETMASSGAPEAVHAAIRVVSTHVEAHPEALELQMSLARMLGSINQTERADAAARRVLDSETLTVGGLSMVQWELRKAAGSLLVDLEVLRWINADNEDRPSRMKAVEAARNRLVPLVADADKDPQLMRADAKIAYIKEEFPRAALLYDRLIRETALGGDVESLVLSASLFDRIKQPGRAHERILHALRLAPGNVAMIAEKARLELKMGWLNEALVTIRVIPDAELQKHDDLRTLASAIVGSLTSQQDALENVDQEPIQIAVGRALQALNWGDVDSARAILAAARKQSPDDLALLRTAVMVEARAGDLSAARDYVRQGLDKNADPSLLHWNIALNHFSPEGDPIAAVRQIIRERVENPDDFGFAMLISCNELRGLANFMMARYEHFKDQDGQAVIRTALARLEEGVSEARADLQRTAPDNSRVLEMNLDDAVRRGDRAAAEQIVNRAKSLNVDLCQGAWFQGSLELSWGSVLAESGRMADALPYFRKAAAHFETAAQRLPFMAPVWKSLGYAYRATGNHAQAERALEQAYQSDPTDLEIVRAYLGLLLARGDQTRALRVLRNSRAIAPNDQNLRHFWLQLEAETGNTPLALRLRRALAKNYPDDLLNALELAKLLSTAEPTRESILDAATNQPVYTEQRWARMSVEERVRVGAQAKSDWSRESDRLLEALKNRMGEDLRVLTIQANVFKERGDIEGGERVLQQFVDSRPQGELTIDMLLELARYQVRTTQFNKAIATLERAKEHQDEVARQADQELAQVYMQIGRFAKALEHLEPIVEVNPDRTHVTRLVECLMKVKRFDEAESKLRELVSTGGEDSTSVLLTANIAEGRGMELLAKNDLAGAERKFAEQRDAYAKAQALDAQSLTPHLLMAQSLVAEYRRTKRATALDDALRVLDTADKIRTNSPEVSKTRVTVFRERGDQNAAIGELRRLVDREPSDYHARRDLALMHVNNRQFEEAITVLLDGIRTNPMIALWHDALGDLIKAHRNDVAGAAAAFAKAYDLTPTPLLLWKLSEAGLEMATPDCRAVLNRLASKTQELETFPPLRESYAKALACVDRKGEALEQLKLAYQRRRALINEGSLAPTELTDWFRAVGFVFKDRTMQQALDASAAEQFVLEVTNSNLDLFELRALSVLWRAAGDATFSRTIDFLKRAIQAANDANDPDTRLRQDLYNELAAVYFAAKRLPDAVDAYDSLLQLNPDHVEALNNYSYFLANDLKNPAKAIEFAERAARLAPTNAAVLDTVGWVYFLAGNDAKAIEFLQESLRHDRSAAVLLHMVEALLRAGDINRARQHLDEASRLNPDDQQKRDIQRLSAEIRSR